MSSQQHVPRRISLPRVLALACGAFALTALAACGSDLQEDPVTDSATGGETVSPTPDPTTGTTPESTPTTPETTPTTPESTPTTPETTPTTPETTPTTPESTPPELLDACDANEVEGIIFGAGFEHIYLWGTEEGTAIEVRASDELDADVIAEAESDPFGAALVRGLTAGDVLTIAIELDDEFCLLDNELTILGRDDHPDQAFYDDITLEFGVLPEDPSAEDINDNLHRGYFPVRDGIELSYTAIAPGPADDGPWPTLVEYTGYDSGNVGSSRWLHWLSQGYAVVGVNIRGTGCSGGAFDYFSVLEALDGYDMIETIAAQDWTTRVGTFGFSYGGISQLLVGGIQPPSLSAMAPGAVVSDLYRDVLRPGGILNPGFGLFFAAVLDQESAPANLWADRPELVETYYPNDIYGDDFTNVPPRAAWVAQRISDGDGTCLENQYLGLQNERLLILTDVAEPEPFAFLDEYYTKRAPGQWIPDIAVPTLVIQTWQDEQVGSRALNAFADADNDYIKIIGLNGDHRAYYFNQPLQALDAFFAAFLKEEFGFEYTSDNIEDAIDEFRSFDTTRLLVENIETGFVLDGQSIASETHEAREIFNFAKWPPIAAEDATRFYLQPDGGIDVDAPTFEEATTTYSSDTGGRPNPDWLIGIGFGWVSPDNPDFPNPWLAAEEGTYAAFDLFTDEDVLVAGTASVDLWIQTDEPNTDIEATISEIRDDFEIYVQSGWLRASRATLDEEASTDILPVHTHLAEDLEELEAGEWRLVRIEIPPFAHLFRQGSALRLTIEAPGGNRLNWRFEVREGTHDVTIGHNATHPSSIVLPTLVPSEEGIELNNTTGVDGCWATPTGAPAPVGRALLNSQPCLTIMLDQLPEQ